MEHFCYSCDHDGKMFLGCSPCFNCIHSRYNISFPSGENRGTKNNWKERIKPSINELNVIVDNIRITKTIEEWDNEKQKLWDEKIYEIKKYCCMDCKDYVMVEEECRINDGDYSECIVDSICQILKGRKFDGIK